MPLHIIAHRGVRLNAGVKSLRHAGNKYAENTMLPYPDAQIDEDKLDFDVNAFENTLTAIKTAWLLGYGIETDVYSYGIIHHDRMIGRNPARLLDHMTPEQIAQVNLSTTGEALHDGTRIPMLSEILDAQVEIRSQGIKPPPRMQLELKKPVDVKKIVDEVMARITAGHIERTDIRFTSFNYDLLKEAEQALSRYPAGTHPELGYLLVQEALDYVYLGRNSPDYVQRLKENASKTIPLFFRERLALENELAEHFPELAHMNYEQMEQAVPALVDTYGIAEFERRYESYLSLFIGSGLRAGYQLQADILADSAFDVVHIPMDAPLGVAEAYKNDLDKADFRGGKLRANAHSVSSGGKNPSQILRAFLILDDDAEFTLDYPAMVPALFGDILSSGSTRRDSKMQIGFDPTRKFRLDGVEFTPEQLEEAAKKFFAIIGVPYEKVTGAQSRIGGGSRGNKLEIEMRDPAPARKAGDIIRRRLSE